MKRLLAALLIAASLTGCGTQFGFGVDTYAPKITIARLSEIATPDRAEVALYAAVKLFEAVVGTLNRAHIKGLIPPDRYAAFVASPSSYANRAQIALSLASTAIDEWRATSSRATFDKQYTNALMAISELSKGAQ